MEYLDAKGNRYFPHRLELKGPIFGARMLAMIGWLKSVADLPLNQAIARICLKVSVEIELPEFGRLSASRSRREAAEELGLDAAIPVV